MAAQGNNYDTEEQRPSTKHQLLNSKRVSTLCFPESYPIGLNHLLYTGREDIRIKSFFSNATFNRSKELFDATINLDAWEDSIMNSSGCTWIDITQHDRVFQRGKQTLSATNHWTTNVKFPTQFTSDPAVVVWLSGFDAGRNGHWSFKVEAESANKNGFTMRGWVGEGTRLHSMDVTWIAYSKARSNIDSGSFDTEDLRNPSSHPQETISFQQSFERTPRVFFALNKIFATNPKTTNYKLGIKAYVTAVTASNMVAHIDAEDEENMDSAAGQWIAIEEF